MFAVESGMPGQTLIFEKSSGLLTQSRSDAKTPGCHISCDILRYQTPGKLESHPYLFASATLRLRVKLISPMFYLQNFSRGTSLVNLPGRAGINAGFGMSYNSLVWTRSGNEIYFDEDWGNISPGFRFGFPTIEPAYLDPKTGGFAYLMVTPSGGRVEFRQIGAGDVYETADSSYVQLKTSGAPNPNAPVENINITLTGTDGTRMTYSWKGGAFRASQIKDRNGNFIDILHDDLGLLRTVTDTLGRIITVSYDAESYPISITQTWKNDNGAGPTTTTHTWASFTYDTEPVSTNFDGSLTVIGPPDGTVLKVLQKVTYPDGSSTQFDHNGYGQVYKITNAAADSHVLNHVRTNLETPALNQFDCPRFTETRSSAENFNLDQNGAEQEIVVTNLITPGQTYLLPGGITGQAAMIDVFMTGHPNTAISKTYVAESGWREGMPLATEDIADGGTRKRWTWTNYTQDNPSLAYIQNPRASESRVGDGNADTLVRKTALEYHEVTGQPSIALYGLVKRVEVFGPDLSTVLKRVETDYNLSPTYTDKRIIGLPTETRAWGKNDETSALEFVSKTTYGYDQGDFSDSSLNQDLPPATVQRDNTGYGASFIAGRANLTSTTRCDVTVSSDTLGNCAGGVTSTVKYNTAGAAVSQTDPLARTVKIGYTDSFNSTGNPAAYAYPTTITDPAGNSSTVKYRHDTGVNVEATSPAPHLNSYGKKTTRVFDSDGRLEKESVWKGSAEHAYTRYSRPSPDNGKQFFSHTTIIDQNNDGPDSTDEVTSEVLVDGAGRTRMSRTEHPGSAGGYSGTLVEYDILGRVKRQSVPTEINSSWNPAGDDYRGMDGNNYIWLWNSREYDWNGRVTRSIPSDSTGSDGKDSLVSYDGCGCAGGQVTTVKGPVTTAVDVAGNIQTAKRRTQKTYEDILGRTFKTEIWDLDGAGTAPYATTVNSFNGRGQVVKSRQIDNTSTENPQRYQDTTATFDGHGRLKTSHRPEQDANTFTTYNYNSDDGVSSVTDARGASASYTYNSRGLVTNLDYSVPQNSTISAAADLTMTYDNVGNTVSMTDGLGTLSYEYDQLSWMTAETRVFSDTLAEKPAANYKIAYEYTLAGQLKSYTDPFGDKINLAHDKIGRIGAVTGDSFGGVTTYANNPGYRAWGNLKHLEYGNGLKLDATFNNRLQTATLQVKHPTDTSKKVFDKEYEYYQDGRLKLTEEHLDPTFSKLNRSYTYDHVGRIKHAKSGTEANGTTQTNLLLLPYRQSYQYNAFGQNTERESTLWSEEDWNFDAAYVNNRSSILSYDAEGNATGDANISYEYDSASKLIKTLRDQRFEMTIARDGSGRDAKRSNRKWKADTSSWDAWETNYFVYSSVFGKALCEIGPTGKKKRTFVSANGSVLARQVVSDAGVESVSWEYTDASGQSVRMIGADGTASNTDSGSAELDALGNNVGLHGTLSDPRNSDTYISPADRRPIGSDMTCEREGIIGSCRIVEMLSGEGTFFSGRSLVGLVGTSVPLQAASSASGGANQNNPMYIANQILRENSSGLGNYNQVVDAERLASRGGLELGDHVIYSDLFLDRLLANTDMQDQVNRARGIAKDALEKEDCRKLFAKLVWGSGESNSALIPGTTGVVSKDSNPADLLSKADIIFRPQDREALKNNPSSSWVANAVVDESNAFYQADGKRYRLGKTILLSEVAFSSPISSRISFNSPVTRTAASRLSNPDALAFILLHELRHLILKYGHEKANNSDPDWNEELFKSCF